MSRITVETTGWIRGEGEVETVQVSLVYEPADPFAVRVRFEAGGEPLSWTFGRDLLADGLRSMAPLGEGNVQVQATSVLTEISYLDLDGDRTTLRLPWWKTREFVRLSQEVVPRGDEVCDVDGWVSELTGPHDL